MKLATAEQMRQLDATAINVYGIPGIVLMENAGRGTVDALVKRFGNQAGKEIAIFVGPGNNGGDGLVIARHLHQLGARPRVFLLVKPEKMQGDAATNLAILQKLPVPLHPVLSDKNLQSATNLLKNCRLAIDAIFGTGLKREVTGLFAEVIQTLNNLPCPIVAVDIPSGLDSDTGKPLGACVQADLTVTFGLAKIGHVLEPGAGFSGDLMTVDISIPPEAVEQSGITLESLEAETVGQWLPSRKTASHKGTYGHVLAIAGSTGKTGAAILCGQGALRSGAGLTTLCVPSDLNGIFESALPEAMTVALHESNDMITDASLPEILVAIDEKQAVVLGPGLGTAEETARLALTLYQGTKIPMVVDADGLNILARVKSAIPKPPGPRILTPHPGEMARLAGSDTKTIQSDRLRAARDFAQKNNVILVLKGSRTIIAAPDGRTAVNPTGNPGMATGGMGDVLTGLIGGLLAQGLSPWQAACLGVYAHGLAGDRLADKVSSGYLASELGAMLPAVLTGLKE